VSAEIAEFSLHSTYRSDRRSPASWVFSHALPKWPLFFLILVGAVGNALSLGVVQMWIGAAFNAVLAEPPALTQVSRYAIWIALAAISRGLLQFGRNFGAELLAQKVERDVRNELYINLLGKSMTFHNLQPVGDTMARATNDVREINYMISPGFNLVIGSAIFLIMPVILARFYHWSLIAVPLLFIYAYIVALRDYLRTLAPITDRVRGAFGRLNMRLTEALEGIETVKGAAQEQAEVDRFQANADEFRGAVLTQGYIEAKFLPFLLLSIALALGLFHALTLNSLGLLDLGGVVTYFGLLMMLDFPTFTSLWAYSQISLGLAGARRILELMNRENKLDENAAGHNAPMRGEVEFRGVCFAYQEDCTLQEINFHIRPGQTVAIVGQTGSGKTTLVKLINRIYDVTQGQVLVDGVDVREWNLTALRRGISIIEQDIFLFSRSVADNIAFGRPEAQQDEILNAAQMAQADEFIQTFNEGYSTVIGERGVTLSGGQRQRVALARAFLTDPRILILDDSTSAIDSATEDRIQKAIFKAAEGRTTFIITHRLSQIRWADVIIVMRKGRIAAVGTHADLMQSSQSYQRIFSE
jgi:ATP-binding cassette subfamily B protein